MRSQLFMWIKKNISIKYMPKFVRKFCRKKWSTNLTDFKIQDLIENHDNFYNYYEMESDTYFRRSLASRGYKSHRLHKKLISKARSYKNSLLT